MKLEFKKESNDFLTVSNFDDYSDERIVKILIPRGQWIWLSCVHHENYFSIYVRDYFGKVLHSHTKQIQHAQTPNYKTSRNIAIGNNFFGYIKGIKIWKDDANLETRVEYFTDEADFGNNVLLYFNF